MCQRNRPSYILFWHWNRTQYQWARWGEERQSSFKINSLDGLQVMVERRLDVLVHHPPPLPPLPPPTGPLHLAQLLAQLRFSTHILLEIVNFWTFTVLVFSSRRISKKASLAGHHFSSQAPSLPVQDAPSFYPSFCLIRSPCNLKIICQHLSFDCRAFVIRAWFGRSVHIWETLTGPGEQRNWRAPVASSCAHLRSQISNLDQWQLGATPSCWYVLVCSMYEITTDLKLVELALSRFNFCCQGSGLKQFNSHTQAYKLAVIYFWAQKNWRRQLAVLSLNTVLIWWVTRAQPKIWRKIQTNWRWYITSITRILDVCTQVGLAHWLRNGCGGSFPGLYFICIWLYRCCQKGSN